MLCATFTAQTGDTPPNSVELVSTVGDEPFTPVSRITADATDEPTTHAAPLGRVVGVAVGVGGEDGVPAGECDGLPVGVDDVPVDTVAVCEASDEGVAVAEGGKK